MIERERKRERQVEIKTETVHERERKKDSGNQKRRELTKPLGKTTAEAKNRE